MILKQLKYIFIFLLTLFLGEQATYSKTELVLTLNQVSPLRKVSRLSATILLTLTREKNKKMKEGYIIRDQEKIHFIRTSKPLHNLKPSFEMLTNKNRMLTK